jgi:hypothetical protein
VVAGKDHAGQLRFAELVFHALRGGDPNKKGEQRPLGSHSPVSPPTLRLNPLGRLALGGAQWKRISRLALSLHDVSRDNAANGSF